MLSIIFYRSTLLLTRMKHDMLLTYNMYIANMSVIYPSLLLHVLCMLLLLYIPFGLVSMVIAGLIKAIEG